MTYLESVDELDPSLLQFEDSDSTRVVSHKDHLGLLVIGQAGAPGIAHVATQPLACDWLEG